MGKPIKEARKEVNIAAKECEYIAENLEESLKLEVVKTQSKRSMFWFNLWIRYIILHPSTSPSRFYSEALLVQ